MKLHNTLTRMTEDFKPIDPESVSLYTCGPTVYDYYHIGNLRNAVFNDTLRRTLEASGYKLKHVMNITDVGHLVSDEDEGEDKLEKGAQREGKTVWEVAEHYTEAFKKDMSALNILPPNGYKSDKYKDTYARATEFIDDQVKMVEALLDKSFAYQTKQAIYFDVTKLDDYGKLSGQKLSDKETARSEVVADPEKHHPQDFAVWFFTVGRYKDHTMHWPSPWGNGFPGWHLECSAIIHATLGDPIDIHTGGVDHIGTHHPNEMAQTEAAFGHQLANYWLHNEFILVDGTKMSKSKGNSYTLKNVVEKGFDPLALRLMYLQAHYRSELNFSWENLEAAQNRLKSLKALADLRWQTIGSYPDEEFITLITETLPAQITEHLADDLHTPAVLALISNHEALLNAGYQSEAKDIFISLLEFLDTTLGLSLMNSNDIDESQKATLKQRQVARDTKDWPKADEARDVLLKQGIGVRDSEHGQVWYRV